MKLAELRTWIRDNTDMYTQDVVVSEKFLSSILDEVEQCWDFCDGGPGANNWDSDHEPNGR